MRAVGLVTTSRADWGIYRPLADRIRRDGDFGLQLFVSGAHLSPEFGLTVREIESDGFVIEDRIEVLLSSDSAEGISKSMALGIAGFGQVFGRRRPDILLVLGDRFEMHAAALAALPFRIPVAHIHGGELTEGAIDDALRHSMTKLSHLHFVATEDFGRRVAQLGEEPWRITVSGALGLDNIRCVDLLDIHEFNRMFGFDLKVGFLLVTLHPTTLEFDDSLSQAGLFLDALTDSGYPVLFTMPNADTGGRAIRECITEYCRRHPEAHFAETLGTRGYFSAMALASAMVGNSSSGILEAASFTLPVVNVGTRQKGRTRGRNVIDVGWHRAEIARAISRATALAFRDSLKDLVNLYGDGHAAERIVTRLKEVPFDSRLVVKRFRDWPAPQENK